ncbi:A disintegrin and metalloproteinase with thrombospondin motifs adt-1-like [Ptychodera flava]|uniref:A disintegrin and metalloproteinase with thrombospondin motifs adt-1-like n=1 Tax=Ptychodera flava TaxID=63121 RepID=UPI00396A28D9
MKQHDVRHACALPIFFMLLVLCSIFSQNAQGQAWFPWSSWSCDVTCGNGTQTRTRSNPYTSESQIDESACVMEECPKVWNEWTSWSCDVTCGDGTQTRQRSEVNTGEIQTEEEPCPDNPCPIDGGWTTWTQWSDCDVTCGAGNEIRTRSCTNPAPQYGGQDCMYADDFQGRQCLLAFCPIDGRWYQWGSWSECSMSCGSGERSRYRECEEPQFGGEPCSGPRNDTETCNTNPCPVDGYYDTWGNWSGCSVSCGGGNHTRARSCIGPFYDGKPCNGSSLQQDECNTQHCPINGGWSEWTSWSVCSTTCDFGRKHRTRLCDNPEPQYGGLPCPGKASQGIRCYIIICPQDGNWGQWNQWTDCSKSCGWGIRHRQRFCDDPPPLYGGINCIGASAASESCNLENCPVHASWDWWGAWSECSVTCGSGGYRTRSRSCERPPAMYGGRDCVGNGTMTAECYVQRCDDDGSWSDWTEWSECSKSCEVGTQYRNRTCDDPAPTPPDGEYCRGPGIETRQCNIHICPVHGGYSKWSPWTECPVTCGGDTVTRFRTCTNPPPLFNGNDCDGSPTDEKDCSTNGCPVNGAWTQWSSWSECSVMCGGGNSTRERTCTDPAPAWGGRKCPRRDEFFQRVDCNTHHCPIPGGFSEWSGWAECPVTCGGFTLFRSRVCNNPPPQYGGDDCDGSLNDTMICNGNSCPINGSWTVWSNWSDCSVSCENGTQTRTRSCSDPAAAHGGYTCYGEIENGEEAAVETQQQSCNEHRCPIDGGFAAWGEWPECPVTCGGYKIFRYRNCTNPVPMYDGQPCPESSASESMMCNGNIQCPVNGNWGRWTDWTRCTAECEGGTQIRIRLCNNPSPIYGGIPCEGLERLQQYCNTHKCPVHGLWTLWTPWSKCSKPCNAGLKERVRSCDNPPAQYGGDECVGSDLEKRICNAFHCPIHGEYSKWSDWSECPVTCGGAIVNRTRVCNNPAPKYDGSDCEGSPDDNKWCATNPCPINGSWTSWSEWSNCSVACGGGGVHLATRNCSQPPPQHNGSYCPGLPTKTYACLENEQCPGLPSVPSNLDISGILSRSMVSSPYTVYLMWDEGNVTGNPADYYVIQAKRVQIAALAKVNATHFQWQTFGTVHGAVKSVALRNKGEMQLLSGSFKVRIKAVNKYGEVYSQEETYDVKEYLSACGNTTLPSVFALITMLIAFILWSDML